MLLACGLLVSCSAATPPTKAPDRVLGRPADGDGFRAVLAELCRPVEAAKHALDHARDRRDIARATSEFLRAQTEFVSHAGSLEVPAELRRELHEYVSVASEFITFNRRSLRTGGGKQSRLSLQLEAALAAGRLLKAAKALDAPTNCPPSNERDVHLFVFQTKANVECFELGNRLDSIGQAEAVTTTRQRNSAILDFSMAVIRAIHEAVERSLPRELNEPSIDRLLYVYKARLEAMRELHTAFVGRRKSAYAEAARAEHDAWLESESLARALGLTECLGFVSLTAE